MSTLSARRDVKSRARRCLIAGALLLPVVLGVFWLKSGRIDRLAVGIAVSLSTLVMMLGVGLLGGRRARSSDRARPAGKAAGAPMEIHFCRRSLGRLGPGVTPLISAIKERGHTPVVRECLNCCQDCNLGMLVTMVDGTPMSAPDGDKLLGDLDELAGAGS